MGTDGAPCRLTRRRIQPSWLTYASHLTGRYHKRLYPVDLPDFRKALACAGDDRFRVESYGHTPDMMAPNEWQPVARSWPVSGRPDDDTPAPPVGA